MHSANEEGIARAADHRGIESFHREKPELDRLMSAFPDQLIFCSVHQDLGKAAGDVAALTILAKSAAVHIVSAVARNALRRLLCRLARPDMTRRADQALVLSGQRKMGRTVVIEIPGLPVERVVTGPALGRSSQSPGMVLVSMAIGAGRALRCKSPVCVAGQALQAGMFAQQREARQFMVKADIGLETGAVVAARAIAAQTPGMGIVPGVA